MCLSDVSFSLSDMCIYSVGSNLRPLFCWLLAVVAGGSRTLAAHDDGTVCTTAPMKNHGSSKNVKPGVVEGGARTHFLLDLVI